MPRKLKVDYRKRQISGLNNGITNTTTSQLDKIKKVKKLTNVPQVPLITLYAWQNKEWVIKATICRYCAVLMINQTVIENHRFVCSVLNTKGKGDRYANTPSNKRR